MTEITGRLLRITTVMIMTGVILLAAAREVRAEDYTYDAATNTYLITQTSGNVTQAVQSALSAGKGTAQAPFVVKLQPGTYETDTINMRAANVVLDATGSVVKASANGDYIMKCIDDQAENVTIKGGNWQCAGKKIAFTINGYNAAVSQVCFKDCEMSGKADMAIRLENVKKITLENVTTTDFGYGVLVLGCDDLTVDHFVGSKNNTGMGFRRSKGTLINCVGEDNAEAGLQVKEENCVLTVTSSSFCRNGLNGISLTTGASLTLDQVNVSDNKSNGISPVGAKGKKTVLNATGCTFNNNGRHGVAADTNITVSISDCKMNNNAANGITLNKVCTAQKLENIEACGNGRGNEKNSGVGILVQYNSTCDSIVNCICDRNAKSGIGLQDVDTVVKNCSMSNNKRHGCSVNGTAKKKVVLENCKMVGNKESGISGAANKTNKTLEIKGCAINKNGNCGIEVTDCVIKLAGKENTVNENGKHGVSVKGGKLMAKDLTASSNKRYGVFFNGTLSGSYCTGCTLEKNLVGVALSEGAVVNKVQGNTLKGNTKYNLVVYAGRGKTKSWLKACKKNTMSVTKASGVQVSIEPGAKVPGAIRLTKGKAGKDAYGNTFKVEKK